MHWKINVSLDYYRRTKRQNLVLPQVDKSTAGYGNEYYL